jgi:hypothetical protein
MFYSIDKRHTGGWCGPGQRLTPSVVCQPTQRWPGQRTVSQIVLAPAPASVDQGPGVPISHFQPGRASRSTPPTQPQRASFHFSIRAPFSSYSLHSTNEPPSSQHWERRRRSGTLCPDAAPCRGWGMDEGQHVAQKPVPSSPHVPKQAPLSPEGAGLGVRRSRTPKRLHRSSPHSQTRRKSS